MRRLSISLIAFYLAAGPAFGGEWIEVKGGAWSPSENEIRLMDKALEKYIQRQEKALNLRFESWPRYNFQYQANTGSGSKYIRINAFCHALSVNPSLKKEWVFVFDGGTCYFNLMYSPESGDFSHLQVNGEA